MIHSQRERLLAFQVVQSMVAQPAQSQVHQSVRQSHLVEHMYDALTKVQWNNMLHIQVYSMLVTMLADEAYRQHLMEKGLLQHISRLASKSSGCKGVMIKLALLVRQSDYDLGTDCEEWNTFVVSGLKEIEEEYSQ